MWLLLMGRMYAIGSAVYTNALLSIAELRSVRTIQKTSAQFLLKLTIHESHLEVLLNHRFLDPPLREM
jgi:hypothetical protein